MIRAAKGWDMEKIVDGGWVNYTRCKPFLSRECDYTVRVEGKCYNSWDVNYLSYGWLNQKCGISLGDMLLHVIAWKTLKGTLGEIPQATAFATAGYVGASMNQPYLAFALPSAPAKYQNCRDCADFTSNCKYHADLWSTWPHDAYGIDWPKWP
jgi:hypothetical protein